MNNIVCNRFVKYLLAIVVVLFSIWVTIPSVEAEDNSGNTINQALLDSITTEQYGEFSEGDKNYYNIDYIAESDAETAREDSIWAEIKDSLFGWSDFSGNFMEKFNSMLSLMVNLQMKFNIFLTSAMIYILDFAFGFNIIDTLIPEISEILRNITGIDANGNVGSTGLFGNLLYFVCGIVAVYALFTFVFKRAFIASLSEIVKAVVTITLAMLLFANYSTYLTGANKLSNDLINNLYTSISSESDQSTINDTLWSMFVDRPYLMLQYGTHNIDEIGYERIVDLLKTPSGEERYEKVLINEVVEQNNDLMISSSVLDRLAFSGFYLFSNGVMSIPILIFSLILILVQFWFIVIAMIAPFALLIGTIPTCFGVVKRYLVELIIPLGIKVFFSVFTIFILLLSELLYAVNNAFDGNSFMSYISTIVVQFILFISIFLLRKRIMSIFTKGSKMIATLRESAQKVNPIETLKKGVQVGATALGTVVGGVTAGAAGAGIGASIGKALGKTVTGENGVADAITDTTKAVNQAKILSNLGKKNGATPLSKESKNRIEAFMDSNNFDSDVIKDTITQFEQAGLKDVSSKELNDAYFTLQKKYADTEMPKEISSELANQVKQNRDSEKRASQRITMLSNMKPMPTETMNNTKMFFKNHGVEELGQEIGEELNRAGLDNVTEEELSTQFKHMEKQFNKGNIKGDFTSNFVQGIKKQRQASENNETYQKVFTKKQKPSGTSQSAAQFFVNTDSDTQQFAKELVDQLEQAGLKDVSVQEIETQYNKMKRTFGNPKALTKDEYVYNFTKGIIENRQTVQNGESNELEPVVLTPQTPKSDQPISSSMPQTTKHEKLQVSSTSSPAPKHNVETNTTTDVKTEKRKEVKKVEIEQQTEVNITQSQIDKPTKVRTESPINQQPKIVDDNQTPNTNILTKLNPRKSNNKEGKE